MDLDQHFHAGGPGLGSQFAEEGVGLRDHERTGAGLLDGITGRIEPDRRDAAFLEAGKNGVEIGGAML